MAYILVEGHNDTEENRKLSHQIPRLQIEGQICPVKSSHIMVKDAIDIPAEDKGKIEIVQAPVVHTAVKTDGQRVGRGRR
jgi:hypothetical protein